MCVDVTVSQTDPESAPYNCHGLILRCICVSVPLEETVALQIREHPGGNAVFTKNEIGVVIGSASLVI